MAISVGQHVANTGLKMIGNRAHHCWDHIMRIYAAAGVKEFWGYKGKYLPCYRNSTRHRNCRTTNTWIYSCARSCFDGTKRMWKWKRETRMGQKFMKIESMLPLHLYDKIGPGDWLWVHNKNTSDPMGNHSVMFLEWTDKSKLIANVVSAGAETGLKKHSFYFHYSPVVWWEKPVRISNRKFATSW